MSQQLVFIISISLFFLLIAIFIILFLQLYKRRQETYLQEKKLTETTFQNQLLQTQIEIQEQTLANISQELHDNIGQSLTLAKLNLNTLPIVNNDQLNTQITNTKTILSNTLTNIRDLAKSMLGEKVAEIGIEEAIRNELRHIEQSGKYKVDFQSEGEPYLLDPQKEIVGFRILQEALHNIIKHAEATNISAFFDYTEIGINIKLKDNGKGFDQNILNIKETGVGLKNMQNRAKLINANFHIESYTNQGTLLSLSINK